MPEKTINHPEFGEVTPSEIAAILRYRATGEFPPDPDEDDLDFSSTGPMPEEGESDPSPADSKS